MHKLSRQIRFAVSPFANSLQMGSNSYCAKPTADGLALFFALWVELKGKANADTGFVVNVTDIDKIIREKGIKIFDEFVRNCLAPTPAVGGCSFEQIGQLLSKVWQKIEKDFLPARIDSLSVELMPARKIGIKEKDGGMLYFSEKFEFSASHTLWNDKLSDDENEKIFGKCANRTGHGHNYIVEVTIKKSQQSRDSNGAVKAAVFEQIVNNQFIRLVDHKNLNTDVEYFKKTNPTVENIAEFAFNQLAEKFKPLDLDCVTVWENDRTFCSFRAG
ncbi:MAG: 6-carboxytetrahydropterin synthase [Phycisphaerae bacterium]|nr:6-carboxytetrahydropterin synthase [Phycisphaerae bacterium]